MNHRERVLTAFGLKKPDRVPRSIGFAPAALEKFRKKTGADSPHVHWDLDLKGVGLTAPDIDYADRFEKYYQDEDRPFVFEPGGEYPAEWGVATMPAGLYHFGRPLFPLQSAESVRDIENYPFPDYLKEWGHDHLEYEIQKHRSQGYPVMAGPRHIFQTSWLLRSREELFVDFYQRPEMAEAIIERVTKSSTEVAVRLVEAGIDILSISDDIGMQDRMMIDPDLWREWIKPRWAQLIRKAKKIHPDLHVAYHSDGYIEPVIPDLIEIGVTVLKTVQPESMDPFAVKKKWGDRVALAGTIGLQSELRFGTPEQVKAIVKRQIAGLGAGGGFMLSPGNTVEPDVPWENIAALMDAAEEYGWYRRNG